MALSAFFFLVFAQSKVEVIPTPNNGAVPDAEIDGQDNIHLAYVSGSDAYYVKSTDQAKTFGAPIRVNSEAGSVHPPNMFRGPDLAVGKDNQVHVIWYNNSYQRKLPQDQWGVMYSQLAADKSSFVPARNINRKPSDNYSLAADDKGSVAIVWMAGGVFLNLSRDGGKTFSEPQKIVPDPCECCASRAAYTPDGGLFCIYRDKGSNMRDMFLVGLPKGGGSSKIKLSSQPWQIAQCPMTGCFLSAGKTGAVAAWETKGRVYWGRTDKSGRLLPPGEIDAGRGKYPVALWAPDGMVLVAWKSSSGMEWQIYDASGKPQGKPGSGPGGGPDRPAGVVTKDGAFLLFP